MKIYVDANEGFKCHVCDGSGDMTELETPFFDGKCDAFVEGYRYVPAGETWTRGDGVEFSGEMISPWKDYTELYRAQLEYELAQIKAELEDADAALNELGVTVDG